MSKRPTAYELGQEYAELGKAYALAEAELKHAMQQQILALANPKFYYMDHRGVMGNEQSRAWGNAISLLMTKQNQAKRALDKAKRQAWKWYGVSV